MKIYDGLINFVSRLGTGSDKSAHDVYRSFPVTDQAEIDNAFRTSWFKKIVTIPAEDAVRQGVTWQAADDQIEKIEAECNRLNLWQKVLELLILARKDGEASLYMGGIPADVGMPVNFERISVGGLKYLTVLQKDQVSNGERETEVTMPNYGGPKFFTIGNLRVHPSRVIRRLGNKLYQPNQIDEGDSLWTVIRESVKNSDLIASAVASLVHEAKVDIYRIKNFASDIRTEEYEEHLTRRFTVINTLKSIANANVMDFEDEWDQKQINFSGFPDIQDRALMVMCGIADIPATRLLGRSPQGMNSTGEHDLRNYYDNVAARQRLDIGPSIHPLMEAVIRSALGSRPPEIYWEWNPLYTLSEKEAADVEKVYADALTARVNTGLFDDTVLAKAELNRMTESGQYPGLEAAIDESDDEDGIKDPDEVEANEVERMTREAEIAAASNS